MQQEGSIELQVFQQGGSLCHPAQVCWGYQGLHWMARAQDGSGLCPAPLSAPEVTDERQKT